MGVMTEATVATSDLVAFCEAQRPRLVGMLGLHCGDVDVAEELAQDAIAKACWNWRRVRTMDAPEAWLYRVAVNLATSYFRRRAAERRARARLHEMGEPPHAPAASEQALAVREAVASLPRRQRTALVLRYYLDLSLAETARLMDCSEGTVKAATHKAVASLRKHPSIAPAQEAIDVA
jgi:RNA polymerase sigma-70 factor (sigma-E family)